MTFDEKIIRIYQDLASKKDRSGELIEILARLDIEYINKDLNEFHKHFKLTDHIDDSRIAKQRLMITLTQKGLDYLNSQERLLELARREEETKNLNLQDLKNKVENFSEQSEFWSSSIERNSKQIKLIQSQKIIIWISLIIALASLGISIATYFSLAKPHFNFLTE